jgi:hypothetical protein
MLDRMLECWSRLVLFWPPSTLRDRISELTAGARAIVAGWTESGTLVVVTHGANILPLTGVTPEEGGMVIVKPDPASTAKLRTLGQISPLPLGP